MYTVVSFRKMGPNDRARCYSRFRVLTSGIRPTKFLFLQSEWDAQTRGFDHRDDPDRDIAPETTFYSDGVEPGADSPIPMSVWNGTIERE